MVWERWAALEYNQFIWEGCGWIDHYDSWDGGSYDCVAYAVWAGETGNPYLGNEDIRTYLGHGPDDTDNFYYVPKITVALCSKAELLDILGNHAPKTPQQAYAAYSASETWWEEYSGFIEQTNPNIGAYPGAFPWATNKIDYRQEKAYVRPHSKEELQEADMWPSAEE